MRVILKKLNNFDFYHKFTDEILPQNVTSRDLWLMFDFLSPVLIVIHGSRVSKIKYSKKRISDVDIVIVTLKYSFWPLLEIRNEIHKRISQNSHIDFLDISITSPQGLISHIKNRTSLGLSLREGFSYILRYENEYSGIS
ncbi:MAG: hypothetical protein ACFFB5_23910 [Promethearchaeota archaeon]